MRLALYIRQSKLQGVQGVPKNYTTKTLADTANKKQHVNVGG